MSAFLSDLGRSFFGDIDPAGDNGYSDPPPRKGFFTDTSVARLWRRRTGIEPA